MNQSIYPAVYTRWNQSITSSAWMNWIKKLLYKRRVNELKRRIEQMKIKADEMDADRRMLTFDSTTGQILRERIVLLEKAVERMESRRGADIE